MQPNNRMQAAAGGFSVAARGLGCPPAAPDAER